MYNIIKKIIFGLGLAVLSLVSLIVLLKIAYIILLVIPYHIDNGLKDPALEPATQSFLNDKLHEYYGIYRNKDYSFYRLRYVKTQPDVLGFDCLQGQIVIAQPGRAAHCIDETLPADMEWQIRMDEYVWPGMVIKTTDRYSDGSGHSWHPWN